MSGGIFSEKRELDHARYDGFGSAAGGRCYLRYGVIIRHRIRGRHTAKDAGLWTLFGCGDQVRHERRSRAARAGDGARLQLFQRYQRRSFRGIAISTGVFWRSGVPSPFCDSIACCGIWTSADNHLNAMDINTASLGCVSFWDTFSPSLRDFAKRVPCHGKRINRGEDQFRRLVFLYYLGTLPRLPKTKRIIFTGESLPTCAGSRRL